MRESIKYFLKKDCEEWERAHVYGCEKVSGDASIYSLVVGT